ncbi:glycosyltransferase [Candidatus Pelagibacter bacterium]|nr:glycosyltransferase [Candidatus Pelagibacter bacterium]MDB2709185.1 glycosyltransferase [Candidatus Pelagibacter bacterium]
MKIGVDLTNLDPTYKGGSNTYCEGLIEGFKENLSDNISFQIYSNKSYLRKKKFKKKNFTFYKYEGSKSKKLFIIFYNRIFPTISYFLGSLKYKLDYYFRNFLYKDFKTLVEKNSDVLLTPNVTLRVYNLSIPTITNLHDIQHMHYPKLFNFSERCRRDFSYLNTAKYSTKIIASLSFIRNDLKKKFKFLNLKKIKVINAGVDLRKYNYKKKYKKKNFIFFPAQLWPHKNHLLVLKAFKNYLNKSKKKNKLYLSGKSFNEKSKKILDMISSIDKNYIKYLGPISHNSLLKMYKSSICTLCPAIYEASALPMLESFSMKTYVMISDISQHLEESKNFKVMRFKNNSVNDLEKKFLYLEKTSKKNLNNFTNFNYNMIMKRSWFYQSIKWIKICQKLVKNKLNEKKKKY